MHGSRARLGCMLYRELVHAGQGDRSVSYSRTARVWLIEGRQAAPPSSETSTTLKPPLPLACFDDPYPYILDVIATTGTCNAPVALCQSAAGSRMLLLSFSLYTGATDIC